MKTHKIISVLSIFVILLFFNTKKINAQNSKLNFEIELTPKTALRKDIGNNTFSNLIKPVILIDAGINTKYKINEKLALGSGLFYAVDGYKFKNDFSNFSNMSDVDFSTNHTYHHIEIPIFSELSFGHFCLKTGLAYQRLFLEKNTIKYKSLPDSIMGISKEQFIDNSNYTKGVTELKEQKYRMNKIAFLLSFGKNYDISDKFYWAWAGQFKTGLLDLVNIDNPVFKVYLYSVGINLKIGLK
ncbi:MAG: hypothetical protein DRI94_07085 [Bacteroidetes bacterium]|nr:MAG: hypothetical protein DRI94_07085 [Bacteroidota bacterium]